MSDAHDFPLRTAVDAPAPDIPDATFLSEPEAPEMVATFRLQNGHGPDRDQFYETVVDGRVLDRWSDADAAAGGHERVVAAIEAGDYEYVYLVSSIEVDYGGGD